MKIQDAKKSHNFVGLYLRS